MQSHESHHSVCLKLVEKVDLRSVYWYKFSKTLAKPSGSTGSHVLQISLRAWFESQGHNRVSDRGESNGTYWYTATDTGSNIEIHVVLELRPHTATEKRKRSCKLSLQMREEKKQTNDVEDLKERIWTPDLQEEEVKSPCVLRFDQETAQKLCSVDFSFTFCFSFISVVCF